MQTPDFPYTSGVSGRIHFTVRKNTDTVNQDLCLSEQHVGGVNVIWATSFKSKKQLLHSFVFQGCIFHMIACYKSIFGVLMGH